MKRKQAVLITGAAGEVGHGIIAALCDTNPPKRDSVPTIVSLDPKASAQMGSPHRSVSGSILDAELLAQLASEYHFTTIFHLAAILSTGGEKDPRAAHHINVNGSLQLLDLANRQSIESGARTRFIFPSTIAIYGRASGFSAQKITEDQCLNPITMYGANKLYVEHLGRYFSRYLGFTEADARATHLDFRAIRLPGLVSADTVPSGGTSDYGAEMLHAAAQGKSYSCFVPAQARLPFMTMPDAVRALSELALADSANLSRSVYNIAAFSASAVELATQTKRHFPEFEISFEPHPKRSAVVASWPEDVDDSAAAKDWGWRAKYDLESAFSAYLVPAVRKRYNK